LRKITENNNKLLSDGIFLNKSETTLPSLNILDGVINGQERLKFYLLSYFE
jgi:hypothetical protein